MLPKQTINALASSMAKYKPLRIGPWLRIWPPVILAPMAGVTNWPYRKICRDFGAGLCVTEMVSARAILEDNRRTQEIAGFGPGESPRSIQLVGADPAVMAEGIRRVLPGIDHIDLNFGCPVPKVTRKGAGAAAPVDPDNFRALVRAAVRAAEPVPVTVKLRLGLDEDRFTFREAARIAEGEGCAAVGLHARTVAQMYSGKARWEYIRELKGLVSIPVLGNGDVFHASDAFRLLDSTGCDGVIIGRGCLGNPWLFADLKRLFEGNGVPAPPTLEEVVRVIRLHYSLLRSHFALPRAADMFIRKFGTWYARGLENAAAIRREFQKIDGPEDLERILESMIRSGWKPGFRPSFQSEDPSAGAGAAAGASAEPCGPCGAS